MLVLSPSAESIREAVRILHAGGTVAHATETCYGFACDLTNPEAVQKLFALKKRPADQPVSALFSSLEKVKYYVEWNEKAEELAHKYLPGPLTILLGLRTKDLGQSIFLCPVSHIQSPTSLGFRVSSHPIAHMLAELAKVPLSTTSANLHGKPETYSISEILEQYDAEYMQPDLILDSGALPSVSPSTIVDLTEGTAKILRQGSMVL